MDTKQTSHIKLLECRIIAGERPHLNWHDLNNEIATLLTQFKTKYPSLYTYLLAHQGHESTFPATPINSRKEIGGVRDGAVDVGGFEGGSDDNSDGSATLRATSDTHSTIDTPTDMTEEEDALPKAFVKSVGELGLETIENETGWQEVLAQRARCIWADGTVNVVVEVVSGNEM